MKFVIYSNVVLSRAPEGPVVAYLGRFAKSLQERGYAPKSIHRQVLIAACFSGWLAHKELVLRRISFDLASQYLRHRARYVRPSRGDAAALKRVLEFLRREGAIPLDKTGRHPMTPAERCIRAYEQHLRDARGLSKATIINYVPFVRSFIEGCFGKGAVTWSQLCAHDVVRFVERQARCLHPKRAKLLTSALRSFLQYARYCGKVKLDLAAAVPVVPNWTMTTIPRAISTDQLGSCWPALTAPRGWDVAITPSCSCSRGWDCEQVRWRSSNSMTLTGMRDD